MLKYFLDNIVSPKLSGFRPGDSCINQLLPIMHIFTLFDNGLEVRGVFLDISKAFDKVRHDGLIYKVKAKRDKRQAAMSFKWSVLIVDKGECKHSTGINFGAFIIFDVHKRLAYQFTG